MCGVGKWYTQTEKFLNSGGIVVGMEPNEAITLLEKIEDHCMPDELLIQEVVNAVGVRKQRIKSKNYVPVQEASELRSRSRFLVEALRVLEYELKAFVSATKRHGKGDE